MWFRNACFLGRSSLSRPWPPSDKALNRANQVPSSNSVTPSASPLRTYLPDQIADPATGWRRLTVTVSHNREQFQQQIQAIGISADSLARSAWAAIIQRCTGAETVLMGIEYTSNRPAAPANPDTTVALQIQVASDTNGFALGEIFEREIARARQQRTESGTMAPGTPEIDLLFTQSLTRHHPAWPTTWLVSSLRHDADIALELHYHPDFYDEQIARRLLNDACAAFCELVADAGQSLQSMPLVDLAPLRELNSSGSIESWDYQGPGSVTEVFAHQVATAPDSIALRFTLKQHEQHCWTYRELDAAADRWSATLARLGAGPGEVVAFAMARGPAAIAAMLGVLKTGAAYLPLDPEFPPDRLRFMLAHARASLVICAEGQELLFSEAVEILTLDARSLDGLKTIDESSQPGYDGLARPTVRPADPAYVMYTSGSSGRPKGVCISHQAIIRLVCNARYMQLDNTTSMLQAAPLGFDASTLEIWGPLLNGGTCVLYTEPLPTGYDLASTIRRHGANTAWLTAALFNTIVDDDPAHLSGLKQILTGGEALSVSHVQTAMQSLPQATLINGYGPTESTTFTCTYTIDSLAPDATSVPIGQPISATWVAVVNEAIQLVPAGVIGELVTGGAGLASGYLNSPDQTRRSFASNPFGEGPPNLYRTGDLVRLNRDGKLDYIGRVDDQVKVRGYRVEPREIEALLSRHNTVGQCAVITEHDPALGARFIAYLVARENQTIKPDELNEFLRERIPGYMMPAGFITRHELPLTANGKVDRRALQTETTEKAEPGERGLSSAEPEPEPRASADSAATNAATTVTQRDATEELAKPTLAHVNANANDDSITLSFTAIQSAICQVFASVVGHQPFEAHQHFFNEGGNSLLAIAALNALRSQHQISCPVGDFYSHPTPQGLARVLLERQNAQSHTDGHTDGAGSITADAPAIGNEPIAIIGMAARLPGAADLEAFWQNLIKGVDSIRQFKREELDASLAPSLREDSNYVPARGVLDNVDEFDAAFFGIGPREAELLDPQQRVFLQLCWGCMESAGYIPDQTSRADNPVGVFAGMYNASYYQNNLLAHPDKIAQLGEFLVMLGNEKDYIATRTAHRLNLTGPAVSIHTACSTSLVAIVQAADSLLAGQCEMALAGGVSITCPPASGHLFLEGAMMSPDGSTRTFDAKAAGTVFSDGAGVVLLKRLSTAQRDGDTIHGIIRGGAINNDGGGKASFMAPSADGQAQVVKRALARAGVAARSISYIEAHGTATPSGDPIEIDGLKQVYGSRQATEPAWCALGSVKSNIGHTVTAAGVAGLIKTTLALQHEMLPRTLHFSKLNPAIDLTDSPFSIATKTRSWPRVPGQPRRAGVSAFGVGGTNAHVIVEEAPLAKEPAESSTPLNEPKRPTVLRLSAATEAALQRSLKGLADYLVKPAQQSLLLTDVAHTLNVARKPMRWRASVAASTLTQAVTQLRQASGLSDAGITPQSRPLVFVFPGQGAQYVQMGSVLTQSSPIFAQFLLESIKAVQPNLPAGKDLRTLMLHDRDANALGQTDVLQPALFCIELALARTLMATGFEPAAMIGHSIGEFAAATVAGVFSLADAARLVARRGALMQAQAAGGMLSVHLSADELRKILPPEIDLAANNGPASSVCAGPVRALDQFAQLLAKREIPSRKLQTSHAFHSAMMEPAAQAFRQELNSVTLHAPQRSIISTLSGELLTPEQACSADYWAQHLRAPVQFAPAVMAVQSRLTQPIFLELGPRASLTTLIRQLRGADKITPTAFSALADSAQNEGNSFASLLGQLWCAGQDCQAALATTGQRIMLPTYPFEPTRHWLDAAPWSQAPSQAHSATSGTEGLTTTAPDNGQTASDLSSQEDAPAQNSIHDRLRELLEQASGLGFDVSHDEVPFAELGLDSLSLTQIALQIKRAFKVQISFRQLMQEHDSIARLANYLNTQLPAQETANTKPAAAAVKTQPTANAGKPKSFGAIARIQTAKTELTEDQRNRLSDLITRYAKQTAKSKAYAQSNRKQMADPRVVNGFKPIVKEITYPIVTKRSAGAYLWDLDDNRYVDALNGFGMNLFGWQPKFVTDAVRQAMETGYEIGPQHPLAGAVAAGVCEMTGADRAALCNTGSEAVMGATRMARTVTGRTKVVVFDGAYHGIFDEVIVRSARNNRAIPAAPGIMPNTSENVISLPYGTAESLAVIREHADDIAAVLVEPVQSRRPDFQPREFLTELREITAAAGTVLVFDEVVTGFRTHPAGIQALFNIQADVSTYGKVIGGGFPIGVIAGKREFMDSLDGGFWRFGDDSVPEVGVTYFAGTFVRHPLALAAADAVLKHLRAAGPDLQKDLNQRTTDFAKELNTFAQSVGAPVEIRHFSSFWKITFTADHLLQELLFPMMRLRGVHILDGFPSFMTTAHSNADLDVIKNAFKESVIELQRGRFLPALGVKPGVLFDAKRPPVPGARLGRDQNGKPAWFIPNPDAPGKYLRIDDHV